MTVNRITVFLLPKLHYTLFNPSHIVITIGAVWTIVLGYVVALNIDGCHKSFNSDGFFMYHDCSNRSGSESVVLRFQTKKIHRGEDANG
ncbi:hypothetical protein L596_030741 [Steinernema carpocapsae]|uniref:Uncharacterized protein n=1 Tax=Steinernema carpocapsae TaxID=34508 RepID=A0A4V5ZWV0_STECR|nr:hypothetical protein L596_030741 [Steinernema carpocapsae]